MSSIQVDEDTAAFWLGILLLMLFAWNQFNSPSYPRGQQFARILELLRPQDLRSGEVFVTAYTVYLGTLVLIYWLICTYAPLQFFSVIGLEVDQPLEPLSAPALTQAFPGRSLAPRRNPAGRTRHVPRRRAFRRVRRFH